MSTPWRKVIRDFWQERTRTVLVVLAIALGIAGFSTVLSTYAILTRELNLGYLATNPASATLVTDNVDDKLLAAVRAEPAVADAEARRAVRGRIKVSNGEWRNLQLFVVKDYGNIRISTLVPQQGAWPPGPGEILIERDAFQVLRAQIGDSVTVKTVGGKEQPLHVSGSVHDVGQAQARMEQQVYGYITLDTLALLGEQPYLDQLKLEVAGNKFDAEHIRSLANSLRQRVEGLGHPVRRLDIPKPGAHPHADIMGLLLLAQASFGLFALLLSGILVINLLTALMASQVRQIGVMKVIGGTRRQIAAIYFAQALLLGGVAMLIATPLGMWGSRVLCRYLAIFLNFDITSFAVPLWVYLLVAGVGLLVPLLAAAYPVSKGSKMTVREALADYGVTRTAFGTSGWDRALAGVGGMKRPVLLAMRNSFRRRMRLALTLVTLAAAGVFFLAALNIRSSMIHTLDRLFATMKYDLTVGLVQMYPVEKLERVIRNTPGIARAEGWIVAQGAIAGPPSKEPGQADVRRPAGHNLGQTHGAQPDGLDRSFNVVALPAGTDLLTPEIIEGRALRADDTNAVVVNTQLAQKDPRLKVGSEVTLRIGPTEMPWNIVGKVRVPFAQASAYIPQSAIEKFGGHGAMTNSLRVVLDKKDAGSIAGVKARLDHNLEQAGVRALGCTSKADSRVSFDEHMVMIYVFLIIVSGVLAGVGGLGLMTTMSLNVLERRREMGVLRAIGASPLTVCLIIVAEGGVISLMSWLLATIIAWPVSQGLGSLLMRLMLQAELDFRVEPLGIPAWLAVCVLLGVVVSSLPAWNASRRSVREAIGYE
jgi:putative ABC transport system permease protein